MPFLLVPRDVSATTASVWVGAIDEAFDPTGVVLASAVGRYGLDPVWRAWPPADGTPRLRHQTVVLTGLAPRRAYPLELLVDGTPRAGASVATLPDRLPSRSEKPFTVLLGSCFLWQKDEEGRAGWTYFHLPTGARPDLKVLCGDQVYLDAPWLHFLLHTHRAPELEAHFLHSYRRTWTQSGVASGFRRVLEAGANYFTADDHEFWNNAPNRAPAIRDSWFQRGRRDWFALAKDLYRAFQAEAEVATFAVGTLEFLVADTRVDRQVAETNFMREDALQRIARWVGELGGPGVLVLAQPVFAAPSGLPGHFTDWGLPDYRQYRDLVRILTSTRHSIVLLTGDVHFGRVATCALRPGVDLVEVISSPLALVDELAKGNWCEAPSQFPPFPIPGVVPRHVRTEGVRSTDNHFLTLEFCQVGPAIEMVVRYWPIGGPAGAPAANEWYRTRLR